MTCFFQDLDKLGFICVHRVFPFGPQVYHHAARMNEQKDAILQAIAGEEVGLMEKELCCNCGKWPSIGTGCHRCAITNNSPVGRLGCRDHKKLRFQSSCVTFIAKNIMEHVLTLLWLATISNCHGCGGQILWQVENLDPIYQRAASSASWTWWCRDVKGWQFRASTNENARYLLSICLWVSDKISGRLK